MDSAEQDPLPLLLVVDAANVMGSVPDGWWRDRAGAARRLRDRLVRVASEGFGAEPEPVEVLLVVEGAARDTEPVPGVRVAAAPPGVSGDDEIVRAVAEREPAGRAVTVVTADRELRARVGELGASVLGPRAVPR
ncbi:NYN domain-containing protein [Phaeacidiphilus oryzae]|uniref:NYN domain-containing protein n=1 Tax=Phaeacidiphilus oryzae TaxID=348818 RepID=UPI00056AB358|nr:NYN domain-containing protein [Phaeacidiphilus oryzae]